MTAGLSYRKFDLHIHTPASDDYSDKSATPESIVEEAISKDLHAIAITDHQTGDWVDNIRGEASGKGLIIFPGVEILVTGGETGVHVVCLFDVDKGTKHVNQFLNRLKVYDKAGKRTLCTELSVGQVADELYAYDKSALLIFAHCHSTKGVLGDLKGDTRTAIFREPRPSISGAETSEDNFTDETKKANHTRVVDLLDGSDENFGFRCLGVFQSSDAHSVADIGRAFTYFKVDDPITIEDLRQCLVDRDTRIRQRHEFQQNVFPIISNLTVNTGFLDGQVFQFNPGLNSILGAKGSGKSLAVEFTRFALDQPPDDGHLLADHRQKLEKCLGLYGTVSVTVTDESGKQYLISREYKPSEHNPIQIKDIDDETDKSFEISQLLPILFLSQNEVIRIAEDVTGKEQRNFIDRFFDFRRFVRDSERALQNLEEEDRRFAEALRAHYKVSEVVTRKKTLQEQIAKVERQLENEAFSEYQKKELVEQAIGLQASYLDGLKDYLQNVSSHVSDYSAPAVDNELAASDPIVKRSIDIANTAHAEVKSGVADVMKKVATASTHVEAQRREFEKSFKPIKKEYDELVKEAGGTQAALNEQRTQLVQQLRSLDKDISALQGKATQLKSLTDRRKRYIQDFENIRKAYFNERTARCKFFTESSGNTLRVTIAEQADTSDFEINLQRFKRGSWLRDEEMQQIARKILPSEFIRAVLAYEYRERKPNGIVKQIADKCAVSEDKITKLFDHLLDAFSYEELLALQYGSVPEDKPKIEYRVGDTYKDLAELSVGQKSVALLIMALSDGQFPIVIDQPEDSLDLRSIWEDVCSKVRSSKELRQFIFTTHNSSVAVASDSDSFTIMESDASRGRVVLSGSLNKLEIRDQVIQYLEGGPDTYKHKRQKYNL